MTNPNSIPNTTEIIGVTFTLQPQQNAALTPQYCTGLHAWFLDQVRQQNPNLSQILHDEQTEKAFTLSGLHNLDKTLQLYQNQTYQWTVTALSQPLAQWMAQWINNLPPKINLRRTCLKIQSVTITHQPTTYSQLFQPSNSKTIPLTFISPTSFRRKGHHFPLPLPVNVFQSYLRRWNSFASYSFDPDPFLEWVDEHIIILRHHLDSVKVAAGKKGTVTGFIGQIEYGLTQQAQQKPDYLQLVFSLARYAPYCGTGHKTTFGLGQTRHEWLAKSQQILMTPQTQLPQRIDELTQQLMTTQKRTGGTRATQVCQTRATILARQEFGETLKDIAQDLEMPYETVKTYAKLARRQLRSLF